jgi:hypothetical protein
VLDHPDIDGRMTTAEFVALLDAKRHGRGWTARCPAHEDASPSLSIAEGTNGETLLHCFAGCPPQAIVAAMGLKLRDLYPSSPLPRTGPSQRRATAEREAPGLVPNGYGDVPNPIPGAVRP